VVALGLSANVPRKIKPAWERVRLRLRGLEGRLFGADFTRAWSQLQTRYDARFPGLPAVPLVRVRNVNDEPTLRILAEHQPDLVVVSGTNLVGRKISEAAWRRGGIVNLHTGISPYVKGGPNCTNWCLAQRWFHLIGSTVMWLDPGIDTGPIIATEQAPLTGSESLGELHFSVMEHALSLYAGVLREIAAGHTVPQAEQAGIAEGQTFYTLQWNARAMAQARWNFKRYFKPEYFSGDEHRRLTAEIQLHPLALAEAALHRV
jgi:folate-dependent phosphoribosylglycinamide formyltransferase PurN